MMRRTLTGPIRAQELGGGLWELTTGGPEAVQVYLRVAAGSNCAQLRNRGIRRLDVEWHEVGVSLHVTGPHGTDVLQVGTAIIHEAKGRLYDGLPLAAFDAGARRFWARVFWLIRIPGGRHLLRLIARRRH